MGVPRQTAPPGPTVRLLNSVRPWWAVVVAVLLGNPGARTAPVPPRAHRRMPSEAAAGAVPTVAPAARVRPTAVMEPPTRVPVAAAQGPTARPSHRIKPEPTVAPVYPVPSPVQASRTVRVAAAVHGTVPAPGAQAPGTVAGTMQPRTARPIAAVVVAAVATPITNPAVTVVPVWSSFATLRSTPTGGPSRPGSTPRRSRVARSSVPSTTAAPLPTTAGPSA